MELKPGYKQTVEGKIPEDWVEETFGKISVMYGRIGWQGLKQSEFTTNSGEPFLITGVDFEGRSINWETVYHVSRDRYDMAPEIQLHSGDVLMTKDGTIGKVLYLEAIPYPGLATLNSHLLVFRPIGNLYIPRFMYYQLLSPRFKRHIDVHKSGSTFFGLSQDATGKYLALLPPLIEQRAIAGALFDVDALLDGLDRLIAKKRDIKQATMQELLTGKTRLPGFEGEWEEKELGDCGSIMSGGTPNTSKAEYWNGNIPWCTPTDITALQRRKYLIETSRTISQTGLHASSTKLIPPNSLIITSRATIGECAINLVEMATNQGFKNIIPASDIDVGFLYYLMTIQKLNLQVLCGGSTFLEISKHQISDFKIHIPIQKDEQSAIASVLSDMDNEIGALEQRRRKTEDLKKSMMHELLTGKIRLVRPETAKVSSETKHNWEIKEAVVIAALSKHFGTEQYPLGRKRCTKLTYLMHRHIEGKAEGYLKKAAGPYNPKVKYKGPEVIAIKNCYIQEHKNGRYSGYIAAGNITQAESYFEKWYGPDVLQWLEQFRFSKNDHLEVLATVDMAVVELRKAGENVDVVSVKNVIINHPDWQAKLGREVFADRKIAEAIEIRDTLFCNEEVH